MSLQSWGRAGGWTAVAAAIALLAFLFARLDRWENRIATLEKSSIWQETVLYLIAQKERIRVPPRPIRKARPDPDMLLDDLFAADTNRTPEGGCQ